MLHKAAAQQLVEAHINAEYWYHPYYRSTGPLVILEDKTIETAYGWVFFFDTAPKVHTPDDELSIKMDNFILVLKQDGSLHRTGPPFPTSYQPETEKARHPVQLIGNPYMSPAEAIADYELQITESDKYQSWQEQNKFKLPLDLQAARVVARFYRNSLEVLMSDNLFSTPYVVFDEMTIEHERGWFFWLGKREFYEKRTVSHLIHCHPFPPVPNLVFVEKATGFPEMFADDSAYGGINEFVEWGIAELYDEKWAAFYQTLSGRWPDDWSLNQEL